ncbi:MAG: chorismate mutase [Bacteroidales bacterium]
MKEELNLKEITQWDVCKGRPLTICGPCSAESEQQVMETAIELVKLKKVDIFRAGIWKPRTRPNSFEGVGREGLKWLRNVKKETGIPVATEVANASHVNDALKFGVDVLWIGARTSANPFAMQEIADALNGVDSMVFVKNPVNPELNLWIGAIERVAKAGITKIGAIHRGFSTYEHIQYRNQPKWLLPIELKRIIPDIPLICDPSHIGGAREYLFELAQKAMDLNYNGLMIESHINPEAALSDKEQQVTPVQLNNLLNRLVFRDSVSNNLAFIDTLGELRSQIDLYDDQLLELIEQRMFVAKTIGKYKKENNITILQSHRWEEIMQKAVLQGESKGLSQEFINNLFKAVHQESINHQNRVMNN